jgi:hypothetical protein
MPKTLIKSIIDLTVSFDQLINKLVTLNYQFNHYIAY